MKEITQYLKDVATLECQLYTQKRMISVLNRKMRPLGISQSYRKPVWSAWKFPQDFDFIPYSGISVLCGGILWGAVRLFYYIMHLEKQSLAKNDLLAGLQIIWIIAKPFVVALIEVYLVYIIISNIRECITHNTTNKKRYKKELKKYNAAVEQDRKRVANELQVKRLLEAQLKQVEQEKNVTQIALDSMYSLDIIHPKYHDLVAVSTFYDYFDTGRCVSLTGPGGAYDTYEYETRLGRIETKLDVIITKLDEIIANQQYLGDLMREANSTLYRIEKQNDSMMKSMNRIQENTELTEYNTRCAAQSAAIMEHIAVYHALKCE